MPPQVRYCDLAHLIFEKGRLDNGLKKNEIEVWAAGRIVFALHIVNDPFFQTMHTRRQW